MPTTLPHLWQAAMLTTLYVVWAALLFGGFVFGRSTPDRTRRMPTWTRMASSATLVLIAWLWVGFTHDLPIAGYAVLIALGMSLGLLGDLILAAVLPLAQPVIGGITAFGLGHVAYLLAALRFENQYKLDAPLPRWSMLVLWLLVGLGGWYLLVLRGQRPTVLHWAALPYALLLASVAGLYAGLALQAAAFVPVAVGAALFLLSDLILATQLFNGKSFPLIGDLIWLTYGPGQALLVASVASALQVAGGKI